MTMIACPECTAEVSDAAKDCPKCGVQLRKPTRGFFGKIFKWTFILFNLLMLAWMVSVWGLVGDTISASSSGAEQAGTAIGGAIGTGFLMVVWGIGDLVLGMFVLFTRAK